jgi:cytochrome c biogenesis protein ResB
MSERSGKTLLQRLASARLAAVLIAILMAMAVVNVLIPQRTYMSEAAMEEFRIAQPVLARIAELIGLDDVFGGWLVVGVAALLAVNLLACTYLRLRRRVRTPPVSVPRDAKRLEIDGAHWAEPALFVDAAAGVLAVRHWKVLAREEDGLVARRGGTGMWGSIVLHAGLLIIIIGGAASVATSFAGVMVVSEGQEVFDAEPAYLAVDRRPLVGDEFTGARIALDRTSVEYEGDEIVSVVAEMTGVTTDGTLVTKDVRVNHPLEVSGASFLLQDTGYAAQLVVRTEEGVDPIVANLGSGTPEGWTDALSYVSGGTTYTFQMLATPVPLEEGEELPADALVLRDPRLRIRVLDGERILGETQLAPGEVLETEELGVTFEGLRLWNRYLVRRDPARWLVYLGFWAAIAGTTWRFLVPEVRLSVRVDTAGAGASALVAARSRPWRNARRWAVSEAEEALERLAKAGIEEAIR